MMLRYKKQIKRYKMLLRLANNHLQTAELEYSKVLAQVKQLKENIQKIKGNKQQQQDDLLPVPAQALVPMVTMNTVKGRLGFVQYLDKVINLQSQTLTKYEHELTIKKAAWLKLKTEKQQLEKLLTKVTQEYNAALDKKEQVELDEVASIATIYKDKH